jgi:alpha/beta superfamily hydrolase
LQEIPEIRKGFALSAWDIYSNTKMLSNKKRIEELEKEADGYFVLNKRSGKVLFAAVLAEPGYHDLLNSATRLAGKQVVMLDEHHENEALANAFKKANHNYFEYAVWNTDHSFTNKRISLIKKVLSFLDKP